MVHDKTLKRNNLLNDSSFLWETWETLCFLRVLTLICLVNISFLFSKYFSKRLGFIQITLVYDAEKSKWLPFQAPRTAKIKRKVIYLQAGSSVPLMKAVGFSFHTFGEEWCVSGSSSPNSLWQFISIIILKSSALAFISSPQVSHTVSGESFPST